MEGSLYGSSCLPINVRTTVRPVGNPYVRNLHSRLVVLILRGMKNFSEHIYVNRLAPYQESIFSRTFFPNECSHTAVLDFSFSPTFPN